MARSVFWADPSRLRDLVDEVTVDAGDGLGAETGDRDVPWRPAPEQVDPETVHRVEPEPTPSAPKVDWARARASARTAAGDEGTDEEADALEETEEVGQTEPQDTSGEAGDERRFRDPSSPDGTPAVEAVEAVAADHDPDRDPDSENESVRDGVVETSTQGDIDPASTTTPVPDGDIGARLDLVIAMAQERCGAERVFVADSSGLPMRMSGHEDADFVASAALASRYYEQMRQLLQVEGALCGDLILAGGRHVVLIESDTPAGSIFLGFESSSAPSLRWVQQLQRSLRYALVEWGKRDDG